MKKLVSIVVPAFNEEENLPELIARLQRLWKLECGYEFEAVIVDNGSTDNTWAILQRIKTSDSRFRPIQLSRNFGGDGGILAGLSSINGDACVVMMADLQDPPEIIPEFLRLWENGYENISGRIVRRSDVSRLRSLNSKIFYRIAERVSQGVIKRDVSDFRLADKKVYLAVLRMSETRPLTRSLFSWVGFKSGFVEFERQPRFGGRSKASTKWVINLAVRAILQESTAPLRFITFMGLLGAGIGFLALAGFVLLFLTAGVPFDGFGTIIGLILLSFSVLSFFIGVIGEYIGVILDHVKQRPNFIIKQNA